MDIYEFQQSDGYRQTIKPRKRNQNFSAQYLDYQIKHLSVRYPFLTRDQIKGKAKENWKKQDKKATKYGRISTRRQSKLLKSETGKFNIFDNAYPKYALFEDPLNISEPYSVLTCSSNRAMRNVDVSPQTLGILRKNGKSRTSKEFKVTFIDEKRNITDNVLEVSDNNSDLNVKQLNFPTSNSTSKSSDSENGRKIQNYKNYNNQKEGKIISKWKQLTTGDKVDKSLSIDLKLSDPYEITENSSDSEFELCPLQKRFGFGCEETVNSIPYESCNFEDKKNASYEYQLSSSSSPFKCKSTLSEYKHPKAENNYYEEYSDRILNLSELKIRPFENVTENVVDMKESNQDYLFTNRKESLYNFHPNDDLISSGRQFENSMKDNKNVESLNLFALPSDADFGRLNKSNSKSKNKSFDEKIWQKTKHQKDVSLETTELPLSKDLKETLKLENLLSSDNGKSIELSNAHNETQSKSHDKLDLEKIVSSPASGNEIEFVHSNGPSALNKDGIFSVRIKEIFNITNEYNSRFSSKKGAKSESYNSFRESHIDNGHGLFDLSISPIQSPLIYENKLVAPLSSMDISDVLSENTSNLSFVFNSTKNNLESSREVDDVIELMRKVGSTIELSSDLPLSAYSEVETDLITDDEFGDLDKYELQKEPGIHPRSKNSTTVNESYFPKQILHNGKSKKRRSSKRLKSILKRKQKCNKRNTKTEKQLNSPEIEFKPSSGDKEQLYSLIVVDDDANMVLRNTGKIEEKFITKNPETEAQKLKKLNLKHAERNLINSCEENNFEISSVSDDIFSLSSNEDLLLENITNKQLNSVDLKSSIYSDCAFEFDESSEEKTEKDLSSENSPCNKKQSYVENKCKGNITFEDQKLPQNIRTTKIKHKNRKNFVDSIPESLSVLDKCLENPVDQNISTTDSEEISSKFKIVNTKRRQQYSNSQKPHLKCFKATMQNQPTASLFEKNTVQESVTYKTENEDVFSLSSDEDLFQNSSGKSKHSGKTEAQGNNGFGLLCELFGND